MKRKNILTFKKILLGVSVSVLMITTMPIINASADEGIKVNEINFPDKHFREFVEKIDFNDNGYLDDQEIKDETEMYIGYNFIDNLKGIEYFPNLNILVCDNNLLLKSLDLSNNTALTELSCCDLEIEELDLSKNTALKSLSCDHNLFLDSLDVSKNTALETLSCVDDLFNKLDLSNNTSLGQLYCSDCIYLKSLNLSKNTNLFRIDCSGCTKLTSITTYAYDGLGFINCKKLKTINLKTTKIMTSDAPNFTNCKSLKKIILNKKCDKKTYAANKKIIKSSLKQAHLNKVKIVKG